jgi:hypothetical protein
MERKENRIGNIFLMLPLMAALVLVGSVFLLLGVTVFPGMGIVAGLAILFLGVKLVSDYF